VDVDKEGTSEERHDREDGRPPQPALDNPGQKVDSAGSFNERTFSRGAAEVSNKAAMAALGDPLKVRGGREIVFIWLLTLPWRLGGPYRSRYRGKVRQCYKSASSRGAPRYRAGDEVNE
jgi:hypothetical protein